MANQVHTEGLQYLLELGFTAQQSAPSNFYIGLATDASLAENATLAGLTEVAGTGYSRQACAVGATDFTSASTGSNDRKVTTKQVTFTCSAGDWTQGAQTAFLCSVASGTSGKLIASIPLAAARNLQNGDTEKVTMVVELDA
jgi:hypothetical protein